MIGLDTNILLRYLVQDDPVQFPHATEIITRRLTEEEPGFVRVVTILEVVWVLKNLYKRSRQEVASDIEMILAADTLEVQNEQQVYHAVVALRNGTGTFEDALIGSLGIWRGCSATLTFDEKAAQRLHAGFGNRDGTSIPGPGPPALPLSQARAIDGSRRHPRRKKLPMPIAQSAL
jgi:predicted nucleic-acid-binding protein